VESNGINVFLRNILCCFYIFVLENIEENFVTKEQKITKKDFKESEQIYCLCEQALKEMQSNVGAIQTKSFIVAFV